MIDYRNTIPSSETSKIAGTGIRRRHGRAGRCGATFLSVALLTGTLCSSPALANENDAVRVWNERAAVTLVNGPAAAAPGVQFPPPSAFIHLAIVQGAVYDAVNSIKGGHEPYLKGLKAATSASRGAAASTAAHHVLIGLVDQAPLTPTLTAAVKSSIKVRLDEEYRLSLSEIANGEAKTKGIEVGKAAAAAMLADRAADGRHGAPGFPVGSAPGQWRPVGPGFVNDPGGWVRNVRPFTLPRVDYYQTSGPNALTSAQYAAEFNEVKALGRATGSTRTPEQTALATWATRHPVLMLFEALRQVSDAKKLTISQEARLFAMTSMAGSDSLINCFSEKARWSFWRPTTAIQLADTDGNDATVADVAWTALLPVPPYSDEPSGANCLFSGVMHSARAFFGSDQAEFDIVGTGTTRHYTRFTQVIPDMIEARVLGGLHFRKADENGAILGRSVADYVDRNAFNCRAPGQCKQEERE